MKKILSGLSWFCLAVMFFCLMGIFKNQQRAEEIFWGVRLVVCQLDCFLFFAAGFLALLGGICRVGSGKKKSALFWLPFVALLCCFAWQGGTILRNYETGALAEAIDRQISPEATIKKAGVILMSSDTGVPAYTELSPQQIEQLEAILETCAYSDCAPNEIFQREELFYFMMPTLQLTFQNPEDSSKTYYLDCYCDAPQYGVLEFYTSSDYSNHYNPILCQIKSPELYDFIQNHMDQ